MLLAKRSIISILTVVLVIAEAPLPGWGLPLSPGDRVRLSTPLDDELPPNSRFRLSGLYEVNLDGTLQIPFLDPVPVFGLEPSQVARNLTEALVKKGYFRPEYLDLSVTVARWAPVQVTVAGEVFRPGRVLVNPLSAVENNIPAANPETESISGNYSPDRYLTAALRQAGGVTPTADLKNVRLIRGKQERRFDLSGVLTGQSIADVPLMAGDRIVVDRATTLQNELVRPSQVTPNEIPVFISNLTVPTTPNQGKGGQRVNLEYGTRLSQAAIVAGCAGGSRPTNAKRDVALIRTDPLTGKTAVVDRPVEKLLKRSTSDQDNPLLMPQDGVVCYDSRVTGISSILRTIGSIFSPFVLIPGLFRHDE
jgi:polysaccharide export outer membrane protein